MIEFCIWLMFYKLQLPDFHEKLWIRSKLTHKNVVGKLHLEYYVWTRIEIYIQIVICKLFSVNIFRNKWNKEKNIKC